MADHVEKRKRDRVDRGKSEVDRARPSSNASGGGASRDAREPALHARDRLAQSLWESYRASNDARSLDALVIHYIPLVRSIARRAGEGLPRGIDREDLVADGVFGLMAAIRRYDPSTGHAFSTYATLRIRGAMLDGLRAADWAPRSVRAAARQIEAATTELEGKLNRTPTDAEVAERLGVSLQACRDLMMDIRRSALLPLEDLNSHEGDPMVHDPSEYIALVIAAEMTLSPREAAVVRLHDLLGYPLTEVAKRLGISHSRAFQIHERALDLLRRALRGESRGSDET